MKVAWLNLPSRDSISFPLTPLFSSIFVMSLDQSLYLLSGILDVGILVSSYHPKINFISSSRTSAHILFTSTKSGL